MKKCDIIKHKYAKGFIMKKFFSALLMCFIATSAYSSAQVIHTSSYNKYIFVDGKDYYANNDKSGGYITGRIDLSFLTFTNKYSSNFPGVNPEFDKDTYSFEPVLGADLAVGYYFSPTWRGDIEFGYIGRFVDSDDNFNYKLSVPYLMANLYYDFDCGLYVGAGLGAAIPSISFDLASLDNGNNNKGNTFGFIGAFDLGYTYRLDTSVLLDLRYRLAGITGVEHTRNFMASDSKTYYVGVDTGFIIDNSISFGIRYEF